MLKTAAIKSFLLMHGPKDLANLYNHDMEVQVNVGIDGGEPYEDKLNQFSTHGRKWVGWTDGEEIWKPFRIPRNAKSIPEYEDHELTFDLEKHAEGIGMTGWNWKTRNSMWLGYDFDSIINHSTGMTESELQRVEEAAKSLDFVTVRRSTSGSGLHFYVFFENPIETANHTEHAALGRAVLGMMSARVGFDFSLKVDVCGGNMWVWHRKYATSNGQGLSLLKRGNNLVDPPPNWRDHISVVSGRQKKLSLGKNIDELANSRSYIELDEGHTKLIEWLTVNGHYCEYDPDNRVLKTHTYALKLAHEKLGFLGPFETNSKGGETGDKNCFCFPLRKGAWVVRRYSPGCPESNGWTQDAAGWTRTYYNKPPDLETACARFSGTEDSKGWFQFDSTDHVISTLKLLKQNLEVPETFKGRRGKLKMHKDGRVVVAFQHAEGDAPINGWIKEKGNWERIVHASVDTSHEIDIANYDDVVRHLITEDGTDAGWTFKSEGLWVHEPIQHARLALAAMNLSPIEIQQVLGTAVSRCWRLVNRPFTPEYPGGRIWNYKAPQLKFSPADSDTLYYPHWQLILDHLGEGINESVNRDNWCRKHGIRTGSEYLKVWLACLIQKPNYPLPYLFFYSQKQNTGKSILHEAFAELITSGVVRADQALMNQSNFNAELEHAVLCVVEETDLSKSKLAYNRIKDWVTAVKLPIHRKGMTPYSTTNATHWIQCANDISFCPVFPGDTRIVVIKVNPIPDDKLISKDKLRAMLIKEGKDFTTALLRFSLPPNESRLAIPPLETSEKLEAVEDNRTPVEEFLSTLTKCEGNLIRLTDFYNAFMLWAKSSGVPNPHEITKAKLTKELPEWMAKGKYWKDCQIYVANASIEPNQPSNGVPYIRDIDGNLVPAKK